MTSGERNEETLDAIRDALFTQGHRTVLVKGGPGTGKTWTTADLSTMAAARFNSPHQQALILTFSVSAVNQIATQMREYRQSLGSRQPGRVCVTNYHSLYRSLLDAYVRYCGVPKRWRTWLPHEAEHVLANVNCETQRAFERGSRGDPQRARKVWEASNALSIVNRLMDNWQPAISLATLREAAIVLEDHHRRGLLHYDSWPYFACRILSSCDLVRAHLAARYPIVFIDEFQDTNGVEWEFIRLLAEKSALVCMIDPAQAIYQWRGADPHTRLERLAQERSPENPDGFELCECRRAELQPGLRDFSFAIAKACDEPTAAKVVPIPTDCVEIRAVSKSDKETAGRADGEWPKAYARQVRSLCSRHWRDGRRIAILCPTWSLLGALQWALGHKWGNSSPLRPDVLGLEEDIGCFLSALAHCMAIRLLPASSEHVQVALSLEQLRRCAAGNHHVAWFITEDHNLSKADGERVRHVLEAVDAYCSRAASPVDAVTELDALAVKIRQKMRKVWVAQSSIDKPLAAWVEFLKNHLNRSPARDAEELLHVAWRGVETGVARERARLARSQLVLMTMHASKGREFEHTIVCGASKSTRHLKPSPDRSDCATVRNLLMVACSRSRKKVTILHKQDEPCCVLARLSGEPCPHLESASSQGRLDFGDE